MYGLKKIYLFSLFISMPALANYNGNIYLGAAGNLSLSDVDYEITGDFAISNRGDVEGKGYGGEVFLGVDFTKYFSLETAYGYDKKVLNGQDFEHVDLIALANIPVSDYVDIYLGGGASYFLEDVSALGKVGFKTNITPNTEFLIGYKFYHGNRYWSNSIGQFQLGLSYHFPTSKDNSAEPVSDDLSLNNDTANNIDESNIEGTKERAVSDVKENNYCDSSFNKVIIYCQDELIDYEIKEDEWVAQILREKNISVNEFLNANGGLLSDWNIVYPGKIIKLKEKVCKEQ